MRIWIDADGCPKIIKEYIFNSSERLNIPVVLVANSYMKIPSSPLISLEVVEQNPDEADKYILDKTQKGDIAISEDIPLASYLVDKDIVVISPRGKHYTEENVKEALATRDLMAELREGGLKQGGPSSFGQKEKKLFANIFNREITKLLARHSK